MNDIYKKAAKTQLRFTTNKGSLSTEQLWGLSITDLDKLAVDLESQYKESGSKTFVPNAKEAPKDKESKLAFEIVVDVLTTKVRDHERVTKASETRRHNNRINELIVQKKEGALADLSVEELEAMLQK